MTNTTPKKNPIDKGAWNWKEGGEQKADKQAKILWPA